MLATALVLTVSAPARWIVSAPRSVLTGQSHPALNQEASAQAVSRETPAQVLITGA
jgi:hypothetical protein